MVLHPNNYTYSYSLETCITPVTTELLILVQIKTMPRRRKGRFSKLNELLKGTGGVPTGTGATAEYFKYRTGQKEYTVPNAIDGEARKLYDVALIPFAVTPAGTTPASRYRYSMTAYSYNGLISRTGNLAIADFGVYNIASGEQDNDEYYPALLRASYTKSGATTNNNKESGITGRRYSYTPNRTFSFPVGRTVSVYDAETGAAETAIAEVDELDVVKTLTGWLKAGKKDTDTATIADTQKANSVSYEPEKFATPESNEAAPATAIPNVTVN